MITSKSLDVLMICYERPCNESAAYILTESQLGLVPASAGSQLGLVPASAGEQVHSLLIVFSNGKATGENS